VVTRAAPPGATGAEFAAKRWGGPTRTTTTIVTVGTAVATLLAENPRRVAWLVQNRGGTDVATSDTRDVAAATGFLLQATGGAQSMNVEEDGEGVCYALYAISTIAGQTVRVQQTERI